MSTRAFLLLATLGLLLFLSACGGGTSTPPPPPPPPPVTYTVSGTVLGLSGIGLTLQDNARQ